MAAEGMTNREVALALFVYPAAVDIAAGKTHHAALRALGNRRLEVL